LGVSSTAQRLTAVPRRARRAGHPWPLPGDGHQLRSHQNAIAQFAKKIETCKLTLCLRVEIDKTTLHKKLRKKFAEPRTIVSEWFLVVGNRRLNRSSLLILFPLSLPKTNQHHRINAPEHSSVFFGKALCPGEGAVIECPSSDDLRLVRRFVKGGSGSSG
jgi:hypothetical protein